MEIPFALSTEGWTATAALGGALIGATAGGLAEWLTGRSRESKVAKAGARLMALELNLADESLMEAGAGDEYDLKQFLIFTSPSWLEYKKVLAARLTDDEFDAVSEAGTCLEIIGKQLVGPDGRTDLERYNDVIGRVNIDNVRDSLTAGYNALANLGGHARVDERIN